MWDQYEVNGVFDEMFAEPGVPRAHYAPVSRRLTKLTPAALERRRRMADVSFRNQGITFTVYGDTRGVEKPSPSTRSRASSPPTNGKSSSAGSSSASPR